MDIYRAANGEVIYQTREGVFYHIFKHWEVGWKNEAQPSFLNDFEVLKW